MIDNMENQHTIYERGRRAAERGAPRVVPTEYSKSHETATEWLRGYNSIYGGRIPATIHDAINVLTRVENRNMDKTRAIRKALDILEELV